MKRRQRGSWWGLYALGLLTAVLLYASARVRWAGHRVLPLAIILVAGYLAWLWAEKHADLVAAEGANARAEEDSLIAAGYAPGRWAPSLTARQANYRTIILSGEIDRPRGEAAEVPSVDVIWHFGDDDTGPEQQRHPQN